MSLSKEEHVKVVNKLLDNIESLTCFELPMFVHNMLKLCKHLHSKYIFFKLQHYFHIRIYALHSNTDSNIDSMDIISKPYLMHKTIRKRILQSFAMQVWFLSNLQ